MLRNRSVLGTFAYVVKQKKICYLVQVQSRQSKCAAMYDVVCHAHAKHVSAPWLHITFENVDPKCRNCTSPLSSTSIKH